MIISAMAYSEEEEEKKAGRRHLRNFSPPSNDILIAGVCYINVYVMKI